MTAFASHARTRLGLLVTLLALMAASGGALSATAGASSHHSSHRTHHRSTHHSCIPRGGGDRDSDNHGGPSDGDGCI